MVTKDIPRAFACAYTASGVLYDSGHFSIRSTASLGRLLARLWQCRSMRIGDEKVADELTRGILLQAGAFDAAINVSSVVFALPLSMAAAAAAIPRTRSGSFPAMTKPA